MKSYFCVGMHILPARLCGCNKNPFIQKWIELDEMKRIEKYKKVDEIEKLLNFLFIVWSVCFLFTNTDKSLAFFYSLIYISMRISIGAFCNSIATSKCTFQYNHLRNVKNRRLIMVWHIPPLCDTWMDYLNGCSLSS